MRERLLVQVNVKKGKENTVAAAIGAGVGSTVGDAFAVVVEVMPVYMERR